MRKQHCGIEIDLERDSLFDELGLKRLKDSYMLQSETSPQERFAHVSEAFGTNKEHSQRLYEYASKHWLSYSTPILSFGRTKNGLPISCFLPYVDDTSEGLVNTLSEVNWLSMLGGGVGIYFGIRSASEKSTGVMPHLKIYDASTLAFKQGKTRRGSYASFLDISHPDIMLFLEMRKPTGDQNVRCTNLHHGINITDDFMRIIERCMKDPMADDKWELKDPNSSVVREVVSAKELWQKILEVRIQTGEPYIVFIDSANRALPQHLKDKGLSIKQSNLCVEILEPTNKDRTAVCCLSSLNLEKWEEWKGDEKFISDVVEMLDNVLQYFIDHAPDQISRAKYSAMMERDIGVGALGFHALLQQKMIPFESAQAKGLNIRIFSHIKSKIDEANYRLGKERGEAPDAVGTGKRLSLTSAIAPNACVTSLAKIKLSNGETISFDQLINDSVGKEGFVVSFKLMDITTNEEFLISDSHLSWVRVMRNGEQHDIYLKDIEVGDIFVLGQKLNGKIISPPTEVFKGWVDLKNQISVKSFDINTNTIVTKDVKKLYCNGFVPVHLLKIKNLTNGHTTNVFCTENHKFISSGVWTKVRDIKVGMQIDMENNEEGIVIEITQKGKDLTYDIEVPDTHNYILDSGVISHNSSSIFMGNTSPSIEPFKANAYRQDTLSGSFLNKNIYLDRIIKQECEKNKDLDYGEVWSSIISNAGSVAHLDFLDDWTKSVFKTAIEIDQRWLVEHAADRQEFIDQSQSLNLFFRPDTSVKYLHACHFLAWKKGLKTLYYCRSEKIMQTDKVSQKIERKIIEEIDLKNITEDECLACSG